jgi:hypothetical protein
MLRFVEGRGIPVEIREVEPGDYQVARVTQERFDTAKPLIGGLSFPMGFAYRDNGKSRMIRAILREIRQFDRNTFFFKAVDEASGHFMMLSSDVVEEIMVGETHYTTHNPAEGAKFTMKKAREDDNPDVLDFTKLFYIFQDGSYDTIRHKLHLMLFLAQGDGQFTQEERKILHDFIGTEPGVKADDRDELELYAINSRITMDAFRESLAALADAPKPEMYNVLSKTRELIAVDGHVDNDESRFFAEMLEQLS